MARYIELHALHTVPPSCVNRDDTGSPKSAIFGGVKRARVSSQAWKSAMRKGFAESLDLTDVGVRTKRVVSLVSDRIAAQVPDLAERADSIAQHALEAAGIVKAPPKAKKDEVQAVMAETDALLFISRRQIDELAAIAAKYARDTDAETVFSAKKPNATDRKKMSGTEVKAAEAAAAQAELKAVLRRGHSVDIALFGRMLASSKDLNVEACSQVAHAISVHKADTEYDYFTAVDDVREDDKSSASMIGTVEFNSSTLYRYANVNVTTFSETLGDVEMTRRGLKAFVKAFIESMPTGKQNTFANHTLPDVVLIVVRDGQPINLSGAFEVPVTAELDEPRVQVAGRRLAKRLAQTEQAFGKPHVNAWLVGVGPALDGVLAAGCDATVASVNDVYSAVAEVIEAS